MEAELEQLPKGNMTYRTSRGHRYCYLQYWLPEGKPCNQRVQTGDFEKTMALLERRSTLQKNCALLRQHVQTIEAEFPSFIYKEENTIAIVQNHVDAQKPYLTLKGEFVRSKSEVIIANELYTANIPYEYEKPLYLEGYDSPFLPDFTIQVGDKVIYWEHCGLMSDEKYRTRWDRKKRVYEKVGITEWNRTLIVTYETYAGSLNLSDIRQHIAQLQCF